MAVIPTGYALYRSALLSATRYMRMMADRYEPGRYPDNVKKAQRLMAKIRKRYRGERAVLPTDSSV